MKMTDVLHAGARPREITPSPTCCLTAFWSEFEQRVIIPLLAFLLAFITIGVFIQVVMRYVFSMSFLWGEELSLFAFIWSVFLGAAVGVRRRIHLGFDFLPEHAHRALARMRSAS